MKIGIVGGGISGLSAGYFFSKKGHEVVVFEKEGKLGGLAAGFREKGWGWSLEKYIHHFFRSDKEVISLLKELDLEESLFWERPKTGNLVKRKSYEIWQFDSVFSLLCFPKLSWEEKIRLGLFLMELKLTNNYKRFEKKKCYSYLRKRLGKRVFELIWKPLLEGKFERYAKEVSLAWFWARIKKRSKKLGYLRGGLETLIDKLEEEILKRKGQIVLNTEVKKIEGLKEGESRLKEIRGGFEEKSLIRSKKETAGKKSEEEERTGVVKIATKEKDFFFDRVVATCATKEFLKIASGLSSEYKKGVGEIKYLGVNCLVIISKKKFMKDTYWLNVSESNFPFLMIGEQTNFVDKSCYGGRHILYIGNYGDSKREFFKKPARKLLEDFWPYLLKINPFFKKEDVVSLYRFNDKYAQMVVDKNYHEKKPEMETPITGVYLANMDLTYPFDRGVNYAIKTARKLEEKKDF